MEIIINLLMVLAAVALISYPFLVKSRQKYAYEGHETEVERKELLFTALGEIEFDYRMKKLSDEDYHELKEGYQREALVVLEHEDEMLDGELDALLNKRRVANRHGEHAEDEYE